MKNSIPSYLLQSADQRPPDAHHKGRRVRSTFLDKGLIGLSRVLKDTYVQWDLSGKEGLFQHVDARLKLLFLIFFAVLISLKRDISSELVVMVILLILNLLSRLHVIALYSRTVFFGFVFGVFISFPSAFNIIVPGTVVVPFVTLQHSYEVLFYHIPSTIGLTGEGLYLVALLSLRVLNSLTVCLLVLYTTPLPDFIKALRLLRVPDVIVMIMTLFHKYIFILACSLEEMHLAMKSRLLSPVPRNDARVWASGRMVYVYRKTHQACEDVFGAMLSRGFTGEVRLPRSRPLNRLDWLVGSGLLAVWIIIALL